MMLSHVSSPNVLSLAPIAPIARSLAANPDAGNRRSLDQRASAQTRPAAQPLRSDGPVGAFVDILA